MTLTQCIDASSTMTLRDGKTVTIRPLMDNDMLALRKFGIALPQDDWLYLEDDFHDQDIIARLINAHAAENWRQIVAVTEEGDIVAYSAVRRLPGWFFHVGDIQLLVDYNWRRSGLGTAMARAIFDAARGLGVDKVVVEMLQEQTAGKAIFERLGFYVEGVLREHACDRYGKLHDLLILSCHVDP